MRKLAVQRSVVLAGAVLLLAAVAAWWAFGGGASRAQAPAQGQQGQGQQEQGAGGQAQGGRPPVSVMIAKVERKVVPIQADAVGTVSPIASVALKARVDSLVEKVHFEDGARVKEGEVLFTLDSRQIDAQIKQAQGTLAKDRAQLAGAQRDVERYRELLRKGATTQVNLDNALTQSDTLAGTVGADEAALENLKVQKSYMTISAPIAGRISTANVKAGNFVKSGDATALATINQIAPVYVAFSVPQQTLPQLREALNAGTARVSVNVPGATDAETGRVAVIDNTVDATTGMVTARAIMDNKNEALWPGTLVRVQMILREQEETIVPTAAVQRSQSGDFVFVVENGAAATRPVKISRTQANFSVVAEGLKPGETVVTDGQLSLTNGSRVAPRGGGAPQEKTGS